MDENAKLHMFIYNKKLQKEKYGFELEYYKNISGKYKILDKNGNGKEYDLKTNKLVFEGQYINKKKNGIGREYNNGKKIFEGEYLNNKRNGKGKEFNNKRKRV